MPKRKRNPEEKPSLADLLEKTFIKNSQMPLVLPPNYFELDDALAARGKADLAGLVEDLFRSCIVFDAKFLLRAQFLAARLLKDWDADVRRESRAPMPEALEREVLPKLERIERHIQNLVRDYAVVRHTLALSDGSKADRKAVHELAAMLRRLARASASSTPPAPAEQASDLAKTEAANEATKDHENCNAPEASAPAA